MSQLQPNLDFNQDFKSLWSLDSEITFLNHGSFGACPHMVLQRQQQLRTQIERNPVRFFSFELEPLLDQARQALADFVGANPAQVAFVPNATTGVNTVLNSLTLQPGDQLLTTNHEYNASGNALKVAADRSGATVIVAELPWPLESDQQIVEAVLAHVSDRTKLVLLDHVSSQTAIIFPIQALVQALTTAGIETLIDGAHAPGMIPLALAELGATYYTGNCHKWLCAPKGAAFLYVQPDKVATIRPLIISHGANSPRVDRSRFWLEFDWVGTVDPTPYLCIPTVIQYLANLLPGGWPALMQRNHSIAVQVRRLLCQRFGLTAVCPEAMIGSMAVIPWTETAAPLQKILFDRFQIEIPVAPWQEQSLIRFSVQLYNHWNDYDRLAQALAALQAEAN